MIVGFVELSTPVHHLDPGAVVISPEGARYEKVKAGNCSDGWVLADNDQDDGDAIISNDQMSVAVSDGSGWRMGVIIPDTVYTVVDTSCGAIDVGQGYGSASRVRAFFSRERAEKAIKNMDRWSNTSSYRVIEYKMSERNM